MSWCTSDCGHGSPGPAGEGLAGENRDAGAAQQQPCSRHASEPNKTSIRSAPAVVNHARMGAQNSTEKPRSRLSCALFGLLVARIPPSILHSNVTGATGAPPGGAFGRAKAQECESFGLSRIYFFVHEIITNCVQQICSFDPTHIICSLLFVEPKTFSFVFVHLIC